MASVRWDFPVLGTGNEQGYTNSGIEMFKGVELIENLAREICQNSLDAKDETSVVPVHVDFSLSYAKKADHPIFAEYQRCIEGCKRYWGDRMDSRLSLFIQRAEKVLSQEEIPVFCASDYNTKGLTGAKASRTEKSVWRALAHSDGTSVNKDAGSAGSYGIGKNAPFACSDLSVVFYNTFASDGIKAFQGIARLATITDDNGVPTQGVGHYLVVEDDGSWHPIFPNDLCSFRDLYPRDKVGTDVIVVGFNGEDSWQESMIEAVLANFFLAIYEKKMTVSIQGITIDSNNIAQMIEDRKEKGTEMRNTYQWFLALTEPDEGQIKHCSILAENDVDMYLKADSSFSNYVAFFRPTGMRIRKYRKAILQHFSAVVVVRGDDLSALLKDAEPPRHNRWDHKLIDDKVQRKKAREAIEGIDQWVASELMKKYETVTQLSIDSGEGDFLPDDVDSMSQTQTGDDILRVNQKLSDIVPKARFASQKQAGLEKTSGEPKEQPKPKNTPPHLKPIDPPDDPKDDDDEDDPPTPKPPRVRPGGTNTQVTPPGDKPGNVPTPTGRKRIIGIVDQRAFAINADMGIYRVLITSEKDHKKAYVSFYAVGEDDRSDAIDVDKFSVSGHSHKATGSTIGPIELKKDTPCELTVVFRNKEKMLLDIITSEDK